MKPVVGVMGSGKSDRPQDTVTAFELGKAIAENGWILLSGGRKSGVMEAVNEGAKSVAGAALTIGIVPDSDKRQLSDYVDVGIVTGMGSARNNINILSSDVVIACGYGGLDPLWHRRNRSLMPATPAQNAMGIGRFPLRHGCAQNDAESSTCCGVAGRSGPCRGVMDARRRDD